MVPLCILCVWIGVQPTFFTDDIEGSLDHLMERIEAHEAAPAAQLDLSTETSMEAAR